ncbi:hypothetical protein [Streptomyces sp. NPDC015350]|uniref:hypothetical protein n=1 Tax=Streptomyces sp. NPDC015350 TaxID=3364955 RepID=UPI0037015977
MEWESRHRVRYGCGSWACAMAQARACFEWEMDHERGLDLQDRIPLVHARPALEREWAAQQRLVALILWRAARDHDVLVDEVVLHTLPRYYNPGPGLELLREGPVPAAAGRALDELSPDLLHQAAVLLADHAFVDTAAPHRGGPPTTLGYRIRDLRATPGWIEGDWTTGLDLARGYRETAWQKRADGRWQVTQDDLRAAAQASPDTPAYDYPALPAGLGGYRLWLQDAHHLLAVADTLAAVADTLPRTADGYTGPLAWSCPVTPVSAASCARAPRTSNGSGPPNPSSPPT